MKALRLFKRKGVLLGLLSLLAVGAALVPTAAAGGVSVGLAADQVDNAGFTQDIGAGKVTGFVDLEIFSDGRYEFKGHLHNAGSGTKNMTVACALHINRTKQTFTFSAQGQALGDVAATVQGKNKSLDWNIPGNDPGPTQFFHDFSSSTPTFECTTTGDDASFADVLTTLQQAGKIVGAAAVVVAAVV